MKTTILQPTYLPWLGYFEMLAACEQYVVFDHVQFEPKSWQQRNRIKGPNGEIMLTVPVRSDGTQDVRICDKRIQHQQPWARKHIRSMEVAYRKAPFFEQHFSSVRAILENKYDKLADLTLELILYFIECLGLSIKVVRSSELVVEDDRALGRIDRVVNLCRLAGATTLYDGAAARSFLRLESFEAQGIEVSFQSYNHPEYPQQGRGFLPYMGMVDLLFNCGPESLEIIVSGTDK